MPPPVPTFIDLFAGCGGFSLGFSKAGWRGLFAVEKEASAFRTFAANFLAPQSQYEFAWPEWLPKRPENIRRVLAQHREDLERLRGSVTAVIGGPPCQGFSFAGARAHDDSRNGLFKAYVEFVSMVKPRFVLIENVRGIAIAHGKKQRELAGGAGRPRDAYSTRILKALEEIGYRAPRHQVVHACDFGVPQRRPRVFFFAELLDPNETPVDLFAHLHKHRDSFLRERHLPTDRPVHVEEALSDLMGVHGKQPCSDEESPNGFWQGLYGRSEHPLQRLLRNGHRPGAAADSHRFVNHRAATIARFRTIQTNCRAGVQLTAADRAQLAISKHVIVPLRADQVGHTLTTLPDDYIHYREARILTPREYARLQTFPDSFVFRGPYTTGGSRRKHECPRYTQIGNAVPPLLAEAIAEVLLKVDGRSRGKTATTTS